MTMTTTEPPCPAVALPTLCSHAPVESLTSQLARALAADLALARWAISDDAAAAFAAGHHTLAQRALVADLRDAVRDAMRDAVRDATAHSIATARGCAQYAYLTMRIDLDECLDAAEILGGDQLANATELARATLPSTPPSIYAWAFPHASAIATTCTDLPYIARHQAPAPTFLYIASDEPQELRAHAGLPPLESGYVMPVGGATRTLAAIATVRAGDTVADIGTGSGFLALNAAAAGATVTATDVNPRALAFAAFNAELNGLTITTASADIFDGLPSFNVILSNPPFVLTPDAVRTDLATLTYRDGGPGFLQRFYSSAAAHLHPGGRLYMLANWRGTDASAEETAATFAATLGIDSWWIEREQLTNRAYAAMWMRDGGASSDTTLTEWVSAFDADSAPNGVAFGYVVAWKSGDAVNTPHTHYSRWHGPMPADPAAFIEATRATHEELYRREIVDAAAGHRPAGESPETHPKTAAALLASHLRHTCWEQRLYEPGQEHPALIKLVHKDGFLEEFRASTMVAAVVGASDGDLSLATICRAIAAINGYDDAETIEATEDALAAVRLLLLEGFLQFNKTG